MPPPSLYMSRRLRGRVEQHPGNEIVPLHSKAQFRRRASAVPN